ncbi:hypothetical protein [Nocardioides lijunqiniae]|uniref:hypothetical protein n=1 Tax=Nocardioides lijunqiniae TaxID=2760832 RepID=UPI001877952F|nr:hypothetical protein [Nocardioides lijunqiniae]
MNDDTRLRQLADLWRERDPVPDGLVGRMQAVARAEVDLLATDWDHELLELVERSTELAGARGTSTSLTLRYTGVDLDVLVRVGPSTDAPRIDGWVVPPLPTVVRPLHPDGSAAGAPATVGEEGRFVLVDLRPGLVRLALEPTDPQHASFVTPTFEI